MRRKKTLTAPQPISEILSAGLKKRNIPLNLEEHFILQLWPKAVGSKIAYQTRPDRLHAGTLFVRTTSSVWVQQLHFMKDEILDKMNQLAGKNAVKNIHFTVGYRPSKPDDETSDASKKKAALKAQDRKMIEEATEKLLDPELASIIRRVMEKEIIRRRATETKRGR